MGYFIENPPSITKINTVIKIRESKYKDLFLSIYYGRASRHYIIRNDSRYTVEQIKNIIDNRLDEDDIMIIEYTERNYLFIYVGTTSYQVTGQSFNPNSSLEPVNKINYEIVQ
jgi:hypothetical protein